MTSVHDIPEGELGVEHDMAMEARIEADDAAQRFGRMYVELDSIADTHDLPPEMVNLVRSVQQDVSALKTAAEVFRKKQEDRQDAIRERLDEFE